MSQRIQRLIDQRAQAWSNANDIRERLEREGREATDEESQTWTRALDDVDRLSKDIEREERHERFDQLDPTTRGAGDTNPRAGAGDQDDPEGRDAVDEQYQRAFGQMLRRGVGRLSAEDQSALERGFQELDARAQGAGVDAAGGYTVPDGFRSKLTDAVKAYGGLLSIVDVITTSSGNDLSWPKSDDTANEGAILDENTQVTELDIAFSPAKLRAHMYTSRLVRVSLQLLQDSAFDLDTWLPVKLGQRIGRAVSGHLATGVGTTQPEGVVNFPVGVTGAAGQTTNVTYDALVDLEHSVDVAYRANAQYAMNDLAVAMIRKLKDDQGRPLWSPSLAQGIPSTINGRPYTVDNKLPAPAANAKSLFFGDFKAGYTARNVQGAQVLRLTERYADFLQVGFLGFSRWDGVIDDSAAVRAYRHPAA